MENFSAIGLRLSRGKHFTNSSHLFENSFAVGSEAWKGKCSLLAALGVSHAYLVVYGNRRQLVLAIYTLQLSHLANQCMGRR